MYRLLLDLAFLIVLSVNATFNNTEQLKCCISNAYSSTLPPEVDSLPALLKKW